MPIHHFLAVLVVALAVPLQAALATCQCFKETGLEWWYGYLELEPTACNTTPSGFGWLQVQPDGIGEPNPPMYVALYSSRTFNGCDFLNYNSAWPNGPSKVLLNSASIPGCESNPPSLVFDFQPPPCGTSTLAVLTVTLAGSGSGSVTSIPPGINCTGGNCSASFPQSTLVTLTATPNTGSTFTGWSGAGCGGTGTCTVTMAAASSVTAAFAASNSLLSAWHICTRKTSTTVECTGAAQGGVPPYTAYWKVGTNGKWFAGSMIQTFKYALNTPYYFRVRDSANNWSYDGYFCSCSTSGCNICS